MNCARARINVCTRAARGRIMTVHEYYYNAMNIIKMMSFIHFAGQLSGLYRQLKAFTKRTASVVGSWKTRLTACTAASQPPRSPVHTACKAPVTRWTFRSMTAIDGLSHNSSQHLTNLNWSYPWAFIQNFILAYSGPEDRWCRWALRH